MGKCYRYRDFRAPAILRRVAVCLCAVFLTACGGGGGGGSAAPQNGAVNEPPPTLFDIQGSISVPEGNAVDADLNDPNAEFAFNNQPASAQVLPNPVTVGGYVNEPGTGAPGRSQGFGDTSDFFRVNMIANQAITLLIAESLIADLDLYLWNAAGTQILDSSLGIDATESLVVPADGQYLVEVFAFSGASNYVLSIGQPQPLGVNQGMRLSDSFVPGEVIVRDRPTAIEAKPSSLRKRMRLRGGALNRAMLLRMERQEQAMAKRSTAQSDGIDRYAALGSAEQQHKWETLLAVKELRRDTTVAHASPNYIHRAHLTPNDSAYAVQWHYPLINLPTAWDSTTGDPAVTVAVVDSGVLAGHPDLQGRLVPGFDFISDPANAGDGNGIDPDPTDPGDGGGVTPSSFHGTHVAGTIGAATNNGAGVAGVAWDVNLMPLRVCGLDGCSLFDIMQAVRFAAGLPNDSGLLPAAPADVINLSLGGPFFSQAEADLYEQVRQLGVVIVASAGNEGTSTPQYPASHTAVLSVSAVGIDRILASYSSFGSRIDVAAPGGDGGDLNGDGYPDFVLSTGGDDSTGFIQFAYTFLAGTSMASPHVAGVIALMRSANPNLTPAQIEQMLANGELTDDLGAAGRDDLYGHGLINAQKAVAAALNAAGNPPNLDPLLEIQPAALNFGTTMTALAFTATNAGGGSLTVTNVTSSEPWLTVQTVSTDGTGLGGYLATINRMGLAEGTYSATITVESDVNTVQLPVLMQVSNSPVEPDVGYLYVLLIDPDSQFAVREFQATGSSGVYNYEFLDVPAGDYEIIAGTDADNDFVICDPGEACGQYLTLDQPLMLTVVDSDVTGMDFAVGWVLAIDPQTSAQPTTSVRQAGVSRDRPRRSR